MRIIVFKLAAATLATAATDRDYRFTVKYEFGDTSAHISREETVVGTLSLKMPDFAVLWKEVTLANGSQPAQKLSYMTGVQFDAANRGKTLNPEFFKNFPDQAFEARNMVWDTVMFLSFSQAKFAFLNQTLAFDHNDAMDLAGSGTFTNKKVELTWSGYGERNGERCLLIDYRAFQNPLTVKAGTTDMHGRSDYWGQIWLSPTTHDIEYGTLFEDVVMQTTLPGQTATTVFDIFRSAVFEPVTAR